MKNIFYAIVALFMLVGCEKESDIFAVSIPADDISFTPISGGALMTYELPKDDEVAAIRIRYISARGKSMITTGSYATNQLEITGFDDAASGVKATVTLVDRFGVESEAVDVTFDTNDSGPVEFLKSVTVTSKWNGFLVNYDVSEYSEGLCHISYMGISPSTNELDEIPLSDFLFEGGAAMKNFSFDSPESNYTVIVTVEDLKGGYFLEPIIFEDVPVYVAGMIDTEEAKDIVLHYPEGMLPIELEEQKVGYKYLFDGEVKGLNNLGLDKNDDVYYTFIAGPDAKEKPFIFDLGKGYVLASARIYGMLQTREGLPKDNSGVSAGGPVLGYAWNCEYDNKLPCAVTVYASNDMYDDESWIEIGSYEQSRYLVNENRWSVRCANGGSLDFRGSAIPGLTKYLIDTEEDAEYIDPAYMQIDFDFSTIKYQYLKLVVNELFESAFTTYTYGNPNNYFTMHELEIYVDKNE